MRFLLPLLSVCLLLVFISTSAAQCPPASPVSPPWLLPPAAPYAHHLALPSGDVSAHVYVDATNNMGSELGRPFVFVEGIDFGLGAPSSLLRQGDYGWTQFHGCDPEHYPMMAHMPALLDSIRQRGFTPVLIDFANGTAPLQHNALLLADILRHLRDHRSDLRPMAIAGASMGGQLARMALRQMELAEELHCQQLYVSLDSPHRGANVPLGLQHTLHFLGGDDGRIDALIGALSSPAARELLEVQLLPLAPRMAHQALLDSIGFPEFSRNAAIANGALDLLPGQNTPLLDYEHALLESGWFGDIGDLITLEIHPVPGDEDHELAEPDQPVLSVVARPAGGGWPWPLEQWVGLGEAGMTDDTPWDHLPGGTRPSIRQFAEAFNETAADTTSPWPLCIPPIEPEDFQPLHSFISTASALGLPADAFPLDSTLLAASPFDAIHLGLTNEPHSEINPNNLAFVLDQLDLVACPIPPGAVLTDTNLTAGAFWKLGGFSITGAVSLQSCSTNLEWSPSPDDSHGTFVAHGCAAPLHVAPGGMLELGTAEPSCGSTAQLVLEREAILSIAGDLIIHGGSSLDVLPGAHLYFEGGILDLRPGAVLNVHPGATLHFEESTFWSCATDSEIQLDGLGLLGEDVQWSVFCAGLMQWATPDHFHLEGATGSKLLLHAVHPEQAWQLASSADLTMAGLEALEALPFDLRLTGSTHVSVQTESGMHWSGRWKGLEADSISIVGQLWLDETAISHAVISQSGGSVLWEDGRGEHGQAAFEGRTLLQRCDFDEFPIRVRLPEFAALSRVEECTFQNGQTGLLCEGDSPLRLEDSRFSLLGTGLDIRSNGAILSCTAFDNNDTAVLADRSWLVMTPEAGGGWNGFEHNDVHLRLLHAPLPDMIHGANHFGSWGSHWAEGTADLTCTGSGLDWDITGQSWNWPTGWPQIQTGLLASGNQGECLIHAIDLAPVFQQECGAGKQGKRE